jgi:hypothetical protein
MAKPGSREEYSWACEESNASNMKASAEIGEKQGVWWW